MPSSPKPLQDPRTRFAQPPFPEQKQTAPGDEHSMNPPADHGVDSYQGYGRLAGRAALVTGGDSGIGRAVALCFAKEGADVLITSLPDDSMDGDETVKLVEATGRRAISLPGDVRQKAFCQRLVNETVKAFGRIDIVVNNAAFQRTYESLEDIPEDEFDAAFRTNVYGTFFVTQAALPKMKPGGVVLNTCSIEAYEPKDELAPYAATKAALVSLTKSIAKLAIKQGIRVNGVAPGPVWTPLIPATMPAEEVKNFGKSSVFERPAQPVEQAAVFVFLASDDASFVTGEIYGATGGKMPVWPGSLRGWFSAPGAGATDTAPAPGIVYSGGGTVHLPKSYINRIAALVPINDVHAAFVDFAENMLQDERTRLLFRRMADKADIDHRFSCLRIDEDEANRAGVRAADFYERHAFPSTAARMHVFEQSAPQLLRRTLDCLRLTQLERGRIRHVIVTSCTGLYAPGLDFEIIDHLGLDPSTERTMIGFMGCYAAINALKQARHIVRSEPGESVLVLNLELCTLHFKETQDLGEVLSYLVFGDGCAASLVSSDPVGFEMDGFKAVQIPNTRDLITWNIRELGFDMLLSGRVPLEISKALAEHASLIAGPDTAVSIDLWAVHPGGRSVLDAVASGLKLPPRALAASRDILARFGNMSSATVMFVLQKLMAEAQSGQQGCAMAFGPGLMAETMRFHAV